MDELLRKYIAMLLHESMEIIGEPDFSEEDKEQDEVSTAGAVAGVITPLGTGPNYPDDSPKQDSSASVAGRSFGGAKPYKKKKKT